MLHIIKVSTPQPGKLHKFAASCSQWSSTSNTSHYMWCELTSRDTNTPAGDNDVNVFEATNSFHQCLPVVCADVTAHPSTPCSNDGLGARRPTNTPLLWCYLTSHKVCCVVPPTLPSRGVGLRHCKVCFVVSGTPSISYISP